MSNSPDSLCTLAQELLANYFMSYMEQVKQQVPSVDELIAARNYVGAITVLNFKRQGNKSDVKLAEWLAYAHFHHGEHDKVRRVNKL